MPSLMQSAIRDLNNFIDVKGSSEIPLDFTMSKFRPTSPVRHPLYQQFFGNNNNHNVNDMSLERNEHQQQQQLHLEEQGKRLN